MGKINNPTPFQSPLLKLKDACTYLGIGITTLYKLMSNGEVEVVRLTADPRITRRSLDALIEKRTTRSTPPSALPPARRGRGRPRKHPRASESRPAAS
jgi:excisionase family DNA binding protein